jgi:uncharacterized protein YkwD
MAKGIALTLVTLAAALALAASAIAAPAKPAAAMSQLESGVFAQINQLRASNGLAPLRISVKLGAAARAHSEQMAAAGYFAHESADGSAFWKRVKQFYATNPWSYWSVGENLLWSSPDVSPSEAIKLWLDSPEHRKNMLTARWREIGVSAIHIAAAPGVYNGLDVTIVTTDFGVRR